MSSKDIVQRLTKEFVAALPDLKLEVLPGEEPGIIYRPRYARGANQYFYIFFDIPYGQGWSEPVYVYGFQDGKFTHEFGRVQHKRMKGDHAVQDFLAMLKNPLERAWRSKNTRLIRHFFARLKKSRNRAKFMDMLGNVWLAAIRTGYASTVEENVREILTIGDKHGIGVRDLNALYDRLVKINRAAEELL